MNKELLLEGAVAGHMNHIYDNGEMTFGELKQLLQMAADGKLSGTEKTDGQNIFLSFNVKTGRAVAARNKGQLKQGGLDADELDSFFANHPSQALRYSFVEALGAFEEEVKKLDIDTQEKIFGPDASVFFNTEVMNPGNPDTEEGDPRGAGTTNVIPYDKKTLLIHRVGHAQFDKQTGKKTDLDITANFELLDRAFVDSATEDPSIFSVETNPVRKLPPLQDKSVLRSTMEKVSNLMSDIGVSDGDTINDYVIGQVKPEIDQFNLDDATSRLLLQRVMRIPAASGKVPGVNDVTRGMPTNIKQSVSSYVRAFNYASYTLDLQRVLHDFSVAMVGTIDSSFINDNEKQIKFLQDEVESTISRIKNGNNERAQAELEKQMIKLKDVGGINTPSEGFVFDFNGVTYKFTGNFAPTNQILGMERFQRFGPIDAQDEEEEALKDNSGPSRVAVVPGAFKPPHKGHLNMVEQLAEIADKVIIIISQPTKGGRTLPLSGKIVDSNHAEQIWRAFLDKSPAGSKTEIIQSPAASPVGVTYDFVMKEPQPGNDLVAPKGSTVILGCGDKEDDQSRYQTIISKARNDLKIKIHVCDLSAKHSEEYMNTLSSHPHINSRIPSATKSSVDSSDFHASDMRFIVDVAASDPVGLQMLKDFVPRPEDAIAVMGILGINAADKNQPEEDQVEEPEIDAGGLREIIEDSLRKMLQEGFKAQHAPKAKPSSSAFQKRMRKRLAKAHRTYLDMGRKDLTKHGGAFKHSRPKNISNAFLAEEQDELEEMSSNAGGNLAGFAGPFGKIYKKDEDMKEERKLRKTLRIGIKEFFDLKAKENNEIIDYVIQEHMLRLSLRELILEAAAEDPNTDIHDNTGINTLKDLLKNTNVLSTIRQVYKTLTTSDDQRKSFRAHMIQWVQDTLAPVKLNDTDSIGSPDAVAQLSEEVGVDIEGVDAEKFIDANDGSEKETPTNDKEEKEGLTSISGEDTTGRNKAERVYPSIEKSIIDYYGELDNAEDQEMFYDYLIANLKLYHDKWDREMAKNIEEPTNDEYEKAAQGTESSEQST